MVGQISQEVINFDQMTYQDKCSALCVTEPGSTSPEAVKAIASSALPNCLQNSITSKADMDNVFAFIYTS